MCFYKNPTFLCGECVQSGLICLYSLQGLKYPRITGFPQHNENNNVNDCFDFINMLMAGYWHYIVIRRAYMAKEPTNHYDSSVLSYYWRILPSAAYGTEFDFSERVYCILFQAVNDMEIPFCHL